MQCRGDSQVCQQLVTSIKLDISARIAHFSGGALTQGIPWAKGTTAAENLFYWPPRMGGSDGSGLTGANRRGQRVSDDRTHPRSRRQKWTKVQPAIAVMTLAKAQEH